MHTLQSTPQTCDHATWAGMQFYHQRMCIPPLEIESLSFCGWWDVCAFQLLSFARIVSRIRRECVLFFHFSTNIILLSVTRVVFFLWKSAGRSVGNGVKYFFLPLELIPSIRAHCRVEWARKFSEKEKEKGTQCARHFFCFLFLVFDKYFQRRCLFAQIYAFCWCRWSWSCCFNLMHAHFIQYCAACMFVVEKLKALALKSSDF